MLPPFPFRMFPKRGRVGLGGLGGLGTLGKGGAYTPLRFFSMIGASKSMFDEVHLLDLLSSCYSRGANTFPSLKN